MRRRLAGLILIAAALSPLPLAGQAFTNPRGLASLTLAWQYVDNTGHRFSDGFLSKRGQSVSMSALAEIEYGITDRLSATAGVPYVFAKYTGALPAFSRLPLDTCRCWHSGLQDFSVAARYRFGDENRAFTPTVRFVRPSHDYQYAGEAVIGRNLSETQIGANAGYHLQGVLRKATLQSGYTYSFVEKPIPDVPINRSNASLGVGYAVTPRFYVQATGAWQRTHGGLRVGSPTGHPFFPPGELNTPARFAQRDRLLSTQYAQAGVGLSYSAELADLFVSVTKYVWGRNAHDGRAYTAGSTWYFDFSRH